MHRYSDSSDPDVVRAEVRHFRQHLFSYAAVVGLLAAINILSGGFWEGNWWFLWVALFWGIGLAFHALNLFGDGIGAQWEDRMVAHVLARRRGEVPPQGPRSAYQPPAPPQPPAREPDTRAPSPPPQLPPAGTIYVPPEPPRP